MTLAIFTSIQEVQIVIDCPLEQRIQLLLQHIVIHLVTIDEPQIMASPCKQTNLRILIHPRNTDSIRMTFHVTKPPQAQGTFTIRCSQVVTQIIDMVIQGMFQRTCQIQVVGSIQWPIRQLDIEVPPSIRPRRNGKPWACTIYQTAIFPGRRSQLIELKPIKLLHLGIRQGNITFRIITMPPPHMTFPQGFKGFAFCICHDSLTLDYGIFLICKRQTSRFSHPRRRYIGIKYPFRLLIFHYLRFLPTDGRHSTNPVPLPSHSSILSCLLLWQRITRIIGRKTAPTLMLFHIKIAWTLTSF